MIFILSPSAACLFILLETSNFLTLYYAEQLLGFSEVLAQATFEPTGLTSMLNNYQTIFLNKDSYFVKRNSGTSW